MIVRRSVVAVLAVTGVVGSLGASAQASRRPDRDALVRDRVRPPKVVARVRHVRRVGRSRATTGAASLAMYRTSPFETAHILKAVNRITVSQVGRPQGPPARGFENVPYWPAMQATVCPSVAVAVPTRVELDVSPLQLADNYGDTGAFAGGTRLVDYLVKPILGPNGKPATVKIGNSTQYQMRRLPCTTGTVQLKYLEARNGRESYVPAPFAATEVWLIDRDPASADIGRTVASKGLPVDVNPSFVVPGVNLSPREEFGTTPPDLPGGMKFPAIPLYKGKQTGGLTLPSILGTLLPIPIHIPLPGLPISLRRG